MINAVAIGSKRKGCIELKTSGITHIQLCTILKIECSYYSRLMLVIALERYHKPQGVQKQRGAFDDIKCKIITCQVNR